MRGHVYVVQGDITKCQADAIAYSTSSELLGDGKLFASFEALDGFTSAYSAMRSKAWSVGETHWVAPVGARPGIVVCISVDGHSERKDPITLARLIVRNAVECAAASLGAPETPQRQLILLPTFLTGAGGAHRLRADLARVQIQSAAETIAKHPGVDVAFVLFHPSDHDVFRAARRDVLPAAFEGVPAPDPDLVDAVRRRECVLFVGAGISAGARMLSWWKLIEKLRESIKDLETEPSKNATEHLRIAQTYRDQVEERGLPPVREVVRELFGSKNRTLPTLAHFLITAVGARNLITTNYDHLLEDALAACRHATLKVTSVAQVPRTAGLERVNVVKFHGDADEGPDVIISTDDYRHFFKNHPAFDLLLSGLLLNQSFLFLGYSLSDPNFIQIYNRIANVLGAARRPAFATSFTPPDAGPDKELARVSVVPFSSNIHEQTQLLWRWLDQLIDAGVRPDSVLLADADESEHIARSHMLPMRRRLLDVGSELLRLATQELARDEARTLANIAETLFAHGWRATAGNHRILAKLAKQLDLQDREDLLLAAMSQTDSLDQVAELQRVLESIVQAEDR
jgi:hypothetical protein